MSKRKGIPPEIYEKWSKYIDDEPMEPCSDAISRQAAINVASGFCHFANVAKELATLPPVNPQPKTGHWQDLTGLFFCSECDDGFAKPWHYCPNCGAKMESEDVKKDCTTCILDGTDACVSGVSDDEVCEGYIAESEEQA